MTDFFNRTLDNLRQGPLGPMVRWIEAHPRLSAWLVLALGMVIMLVIAARDVGLLPGQWVSLIVATILVAGACIWIISWEDEDQLEEEEAAAKLSDSASPEKPEAVATSSVQAASEAASTPKKRSRKATPKK